MADSAITVLLVDDQLLFIESLKYVLEARAPDIHVVGLAMNGREAIELVEREFPDVVLMDVRMAEMDGVEATRRLMRSHPRLKIVMLTTFKDDEYVHDALRFGAVGYLLKNMPPADLIACIRTVKQGIIMIAPDVKANLIAEQGEENERFEYFDRGLHELTPREEQVLELLLEAMSNRQVAERLQVGEQTVRNYTSSIYSKLGVSGRFELLQWFKNRSG